MKYLLLILLCSCSTVEYNIDRATIEIKGDKEDPVYESIERDEVAQYCLEARELLFEHGKFYRKNHFECEDYVRVALAYIATVHTYNLPPAIGQCKIRTNSGPHMILVYHTKDGQERYFDVQGGVDRKNVKIIYKRY